MTGSTDWPS